jgi:hypothetical protein
MGSYMTPVISLPKAHQEIWLLFLTR